MKHRKQGMDGDELAAWIMERLVPNGACLDWPRHRDSDGYGHVQIGARSARAHRLICEHFHGPAPAAKPCAIHSCDNPACCNPAHLRWGSRSENMRDRSARGRANTPRGAAHGGAKLNAEQVRDIRALWLGGASAPKLAAHYGVSGGAILAIVNRRTWRHV